MSITLGMDFFVLNNKIMLVCGQCLETHSHGNDIMLMMRKEVKDTAVMQGQVECYNETRLHDNTHKGVQING